MARLREVKLDALECIHIDRDGERREDGRDLWVVTEDLLNPAHPSGDELPADAVLIGHGLPKQRAEDVRLIRAQDRKSSIHKEAGCLLIVVMIHERESLAQPPLCREHAPADPPPRLSSARALRH